MKPHLLQFIVLYLLCVIFLSQPAQGKERQLALTLNEAVARALENNLGFKINKTELQTAIGQKTLESDGFDTVITADFFHEQDDQISITSGSDEEELSSSWSLTVQKRLLTGTLVDLSWSHDRYQVDPTSYAVDPAYTATLSAGISQPLLRGRTKRLQTAAMAAAGKRVESAIKQLDKEALDLIASVKKAYWNLFFYSKNVEVKQLSLKLADNLLQETKDKIAAGTLAPVEIYQPESVVAKREAEVIAANGKLLAAEDDLKLLINMKNWGIRIVTAEQPEMISRLPDARKVLAECIANYPAIQSANAELEAAELLAASAEDSLLPSLDISGRAGFSGTDEHYGDSLQNGLASPKFSWQVDLSFTFSLENSLARGNQVLALANLERAKLNIQQLRQQLAFAVRDAVRNLALSMKTVAAARKTALASEKNLQAVQDKFAVGISTTYDVLKAQEDYAQALNGKHLALVNHLLSIAELDRLQGVTDNNY